MQDNLGRQVNYLRVSLTNRCNLRCRYCMPEEAVTPNDEDNLTLEEIYQIVKHCVNLGVRRVRLTGGEPLIRSGVSEFIKQLNGISGLEEICLTTNGLLLASKAWDLKNAGISSVNISLDTLHPERYTFITRGGELPQVLAGVKAALAAQFSAVKLNVVIMRGFNDDEISDFVKLTKDAPLYVRFIELMNIGQATHSQYGYVSSDEIKRQVTGLKPYSLSTQGPAKYYSLEGHQGLIGFISPLSHSFCDSCNRLRLTSDGKLLPCLHSATEIDVAKLVRSRDDKKLRLGIEQAVRLKPAGHRLSEKAGSEHGKSMWQIGG